MIALLFCLLPLARASAGGHTYGSGHTVIGNVETYTVKEGESLIEIARDFDLGFNEIADANPELDPFVPGTGATVIIPRSWVLPDSENPKGILINLSEMRLYFFQGEGKSKEVWTFPIGIGDEGNNTPLGSFRVIQKTANPSWHPPESIRKERPELPRVVPPGRENPLGTHALRLSLNTILIHGTNRPFGVGRKVSHGCIRLYPEDIPKLYGMVPRGTKVTIVRQPVKAGLKDGKVYIEVHKDEHARDLNYLNEAVRILTKKGLLNHVDTEKMYLSVERKSGVPEEISR